MEIRKSISLPSCYAATMRKTLLCALTALVVFGQSCKQTEPPVAIKPPAPPVSPPVAPPPTPPVFGVIDPIFTGDTDPIPSALTPLDAGATAVDHLRKGPQPRFRAGYTLPPLSFSNFGLSDSVQAAMAEGYGYAYGLNGSYSTQQVTSARQRGYKLFYDFQPGGFFRADYAEEDGVKFYTKLSADPFLQDGQGGVLSDPSNPSSARGFYPSPLIPDEDWLFIGRNVGKRMREVVSGQPISIIHNYGEYGLPLNSHVPLLQQDPRVVAAQASSGLDWNQFLSREKVRGEAKLKQGMLEALGQTPPPTYIYYTDSYNFSRGSYYTWKDYAGSYEMSARQNFPVSDMPNDQTYHGQFNPGLTGIGAFFPTDMLTQALNTVAGGRMLGDKRPFYMWLSAGWENETSVAEPERFMGYLKALYTLGVESTVAGYYCAYATSRGEGPNAACPTYLLTALNDGIMGAQATSWLWPIIEQGHVHALFSHLQGYLNDGEVLNDGRPHPFDQSLGSAPVPPLLELQAEGQTQIVKSWVGVDVTMPTARVLARKLKTEARFLVTAWASVGEDRLVYVTVPGLGRVQVNARKSGSVYLGKLVNGEPVLTLVDENGMNPTARLSTRQP